MMTIEPAMQTIPAINLSQYFIVVADSASTSDDEPRVYPLESAPVEVFNAWLDGVLANVDTGDSLFRFIVAQYRDTWDDMARLWIVMDLRIRGINISKYAYESREDAEQAMNACSCKAWCGSSCCYLPGGEQAQ